jgi:hypothetical protein
MGFESAEGKKLECLLNQQQILFLEVLGKSSKPIL